jgi:hypothetical protein
MPHPAHQVATSGHQFRPDDIVVEIHTDEGITGISPACESRMTAACIEAPATHTMGLGLREMLLGLTQPTDALWGACTSAR